MFHIVLTKRDASPTLQNQNTLDVTQGVIRINAQQPRTANSPKPRGDTDRSDADRGVSAGHQDTLDVTQGVRELQNTETLDVTHWQGIITELKNQETLDVTQGPTIPIIIARVQARERTWSKVKDIFDENDKQ